MIQNVSWRSSFPVDALPSSYISDGQGTLHVVLTGSENAVDWCNLKCLPFQYRAYMAPPGQLVMQLTNKWSSTKRLKSSWKSKAGGRRYQGREPWDVSFGASQLEANPTTKTVAIVFHLSRRNELEVVSQEIPTRIFSRILLSYCHCESSVPGCQNTAVHLSRNSAIQTDCHQVSVELSLPTN